jgi:hypothetical protein
LNRIKKASELSQYSFLKIMKNLLFHLKALKTGPHKAEVGAETLEVGGGAETNSFGTATLQ